MDKDAQDYMKKCEQCQRHRDIFNAHLQHPNFSNLFYLTLFDLIMYFVWIMCFMCAGVGGGWER